MTVAAPVSLSQELKDATAAAHRSAEGSEFMTALLGGELSLEAVATFTGQLWFIYEALERAVRGASGSSCGEAVADERLERQTALEADLTALLGGHWREQVRILPATARYVARLEGMAAPHQVVAHHYVRYLGDISGGQIIASRLKKFYGLSSQALNFYDFSVLGPIPVYRQAYRLRLDALEVDSRQRGELIAEAQVAFELNKAVFVDLAKIFLAA